MKKNTRRSLILCLVMLAFCGLLCLLPNQYLNVTSAFPREQFEIAVLLYFAPLTAKLG